MSSDAIVDQNDGDDIERPAPDLDEQLVEYCASEERQRPLTKANTMKKSSRPKAWLIFTRTYNRSAISIVAIVINMDCTTTMGVPPRTSPSGGGGPMGGIAKDLMQ